MFSIGALGTTTTFAGSILNSTGTVGLTKVGSGNLILTGTNSYTGATTVQAGTLTISSNFALGSGGGTAITVSGTGALTDSATSNGITGTSSLAISAGSATLANANNFSGTTTLSGTGTLQLQNAGSIASSALTLSGGTLQLNNNNVTAFADTSTTINGNVALNVDHFSANTGNTLSLGAIGMAGNIVTLTNGDSYSLSLGTVTASAGPTFTNNMTSGTTTLASLAAHRDNRANGHVQRHQLHGHHQRGAITQGNGALALTQSGSGTLNLTGANAYSGATAVSSGTLNITGTNTGGGSYALSTSGAVLTINSTGTVAGSTLTTFVSGTTLNLNGGVFGLTGAISGAST